MNFYKHRGEMRGAVRAVRARKPERLRWRSAVGSLTQVAGQLRGRDRMRVEEPVREVVLDVTDRNLQTEIVLDARRNGVDLDRGEVLPGRTMGDIRRYAFLTQTDLAIVQKYVKLPILDFHRRVDTAGVVLVARALSHHRRRRAHRFWLELPDEESGLVHPYQKEISARAEWEMDQSRRWGAFAKAVEKTGT
ncbi:MAG: hypothetical protein KC416_09980 [Myxococcales bacterium]|nr:hypothetical protein [Myxococcales bacterium]